jgi:hypothetical protein
MRHLACAVDPPSDDLQPIPAALIDDLAIEVEQRDEAWIIRHKDISG